MSASTPAAAAASPPLSCEIWIRTKGIRRQAHFRSVEADAPSGAWRKLGIPAADKALRTGVLELRAGTTLRAIAHVPDGEHREAKSQRIPGARHPMQAGFARQAQALNQQIDALQALAAESRA